MLYLCILACICNFILECPHVFFLSSVLNLISRWLREQKKLNIYVEPRVRAELLTESSYFNFVRTWKDGENYRRLFLFYYTLEETSLKLRLVFMMLFTKDLFTEIFATCIFLCMHFCCCFFFLNKN